jgi:hypothetical protein
MKVSIYALEKLIKEYESNIANASKQLKDLDAGKITLSPLKIASVENTLEFSTAEYEKYKAIYDAIPEKEKEDFRNLKSVQELLAKQSYYKLQKIRIKRNLNLKRNQRLEAMMILDELPEDVHFEDAQLIEVTNIIIKYNARESVELVAELGVIRDEFDKQLEALKDKEDLKHFNFLDTYIPIIILHFASLVKSIEETIILYNEKENEKVGENEQPEFINFTGFPKYHDWWFDELFTTHEAYFGLYLWKETIKEMCITEQQKLLWEKIFSNWLMIKKILTTKDENAYDYNFIFDEMLKKYTKVEEEFNAEIIEKDSKELLDKIKKVNLSKFSLKHQDTTVYHNWKNTKSNN